MVLYERSSSCRLGGMTSARVAAAVSVSPLPPSFSVRSALLRLRNSASASTPASPTALEVICSERRSTVRLSSASAIFSRPAVSRLLSSSSRWRTERSALSAAAKRSRAAAEGGADRLTSSSTHLEGGRERGGPAGAVRPWALEKAREET